MNGDGYFGESIAAKYDASSDREFSADRIEPMVEFLAYLAGSGRALEFGIGTGRIALPLAARGVSVAGIDLSQAMVAVMRSKPGGESIPVAIGDFATATVEGQFRLAYLVYNTIMNLTTLAAQVACFRNAARHLESGGHFLVEVMVPDLQRLPFGETIRPFTATGSRFDFDEYDIVNQGLISHHVAVIEGKAEQNSIPFRYVWPSELDLMAEMAGMKLCGRWAGCNHEPFTNRSEAHVSVWQKLA